MKKSIIALAFAASAFAGVAHASVNGLDGDALSQQAQSSHQASAHRIEGKTRADVRRELVQAQRDGEIAEINSLYHGS